VGRAGTHVKKTYILLQKQIAKNLLMDCHVASKPLINAKHSGPLCWAASTSWPAYNSVKQQKEAYNEYPKNTQNVSKLAARKTNTLCQKQAARQGRAKVWSLEDIVSSLTQC
jgi:hypothetical protein